MAAARKESAKKLSRRAIQAVRVQGKALSEDIIFSRVSRAARDTFNLYFESCSLEGEVDALESSELFRGLLKRCSDKFFDLYCEKVKGSCDKYALMQVKWYEYVRQTLASEDVGEVVKEMQSSNDVVSCYLQSVLNAGFQFVREVQEGSSGSSGSSSGSMNSMTGNMNIIEDDVSLLKLGSAAVLKLKRRLRQIARPLSKSKQSLKKIVLKEIEALEKMEDVEKKDIPCFLRHLDDGNLLVLKVQLIPFLRAFTKVFGSVVNQNGYSSFGRKIFKVAEQQVMFHRGLRKKFFDALACLAIPIPPSIRCDLYKRLLRKMYNIRCNEFVRSHKCLEEHYNQQTQDRQVMLRHKLKVAK